MNTQTWTVKKPGGEDLGCIRKLIIDSHTRQLTFADIALTQTNQLVRLPWTDPYKSPGKSAKAGGSIP